MVFQRSHLALFSSDKKWSSKGITSLFSSDKKWSSKEITLPFSGDRKWLSKEISLLFSSDKKNDHLKRLAHFQRMSKKTFKRQILRGRHRNTNIPEEESS